MKIILTHKTSGIKDVNNGLDYNNLVILKTPLASSKRFVLIFILFFLVSISTIYSQNRYLDSIYSKIEVQTFSYSNSLKLDYYAAKKKDIATRPLLVLVHGGGFSMGKRNNPTESNFCNDLAKKDYAEASIDYLITEKENDFGCEFSAEYKRATFINASEDLLLAIQFLIDNEPELQFDSKNIILVGSSAGAEVVLNTIFMRHHYEFQSLHYRAKKFAGVVYMVGAVLNEAYITEETVVPTLMLHGQKDIQILYGTAPYHFCEPITSVYLMLDISENIAKKLEELNTSYTLIYAHEGKHDWSNIAYSYTKQIANFIVEIILGNGFEQSKIKITK